MKQYTSRGWKWRISRWIKAIPSRDRKGAADNMCTASSRPLPSGRGSELRQTQPSKVHLILILAMLSLASIARADDFVQRSGAANLEFRTPGPGKRLALADVLSVTLTVEGETPIVVDAPLAMPADSPWLLVKRTRPTQTPIDAKRERWRIAYEFAPREPGILVFHFPDVLVGPGHVTSWKPDSLEVKISIGDAEKAKARDITGMEELPAIAVGNSNGTWWPTGVVLILIIMAGSIILWQRKRMIRRSPAEIALAELSRLETMASSADRSETSRMVLLTTVVRRYLELAFALPARRRTTPEFLGLLQQTPLLNADEKRFLSRFFLATDAIRYAGVAASASQFTEWAIGVRALLQNRSRHDTSATQ